MHYLVYRHMVKKSVGYGTTPTIYDPMAMKLFKWQEDVLLLPCAKSYGHPTSFGLCTCVLYALLSILDYLSRLPTISHISPFWAYPFKNNTT